MLHLRLGRIQRRWKATFSNQSLVPKLPVPSLQNLQEKYLKSCKPLLTEEEYANTQKTVQEFLGSDGFGQVLQNRLIEYDGQQKDSWLEHFWLQKAYLEWREPSLINVNWWCQFVDHPKHPEQLLTHRPPKGVLTAFQINRAAGLISNLLNFNDLIDSEQLPPEYIKDKPLCMNQYTKIFGTTRVPGEKADSVVSQYPTTAKHIIVLIKNQIFKVDVYSDDRKRVPIAEIERLLFTASKEALASSTEPSVGLLTAGHRDTCYEGTHLLSELSPENKSNLDTIQSALFAVCLDDYSTLKNIDLAHHQIFHNHDATNRWFDKSIQLIVSNNGRAGINGEHTPSDAVVPGNVMNYVLKKYTSLT
jgi:carnitine O-acetyltransferase